MKKSLFRKRLFILSVLLLMVCGQTWAGRSGSAGASGNYNGISYTLYSNYSYYYYWSGQSRSLGNVAVITSCSNSTMEIPESLGGCNQIVIGESALASSVTSLTISKSVKLLEYCAVYYATQIQTLVIEDSETPLYCGGTKYSYSYGAFSFIKKLKSVYIGRNLEYEHTDADHDYAPFRYCESSGNFDVTIGPNVTKIADYCFENCEIKSLTMMRSLPQAAQKNPITFGAGAFNNVNTISVPCYVSWTTLNNFQNYSGYQAMFNYQLGTEPCRYEALEKLKQERKITSYQDILSELEAGCAEYETAINNTNDVGQMQLLMTRAFAVMELLKQKRDYPSDAAASIVSDYKTKIDEALSVYDIDNAKNAGKEALVAAKTLQDAKTVAIAALTEAAKDYPSKAADGIVKTYTGKINASTSTEAVRVHKEAGIEELQKAKALQDAKTNAIAELEQAAIDYPSDAASGIVITYTNKINAAETIAAVTAAKNEGIKALELEDAKALEGAKKTAIAELRTEAGENASDAVVKILNEYIGKVNVATTITEVTTQKTNGISAIQLQKAKETSIACLRIFINEEKMSNAPMEEYESRINAASTHKDLSNIVESIYAEISNSDQISIGDRKYLLDDGAIIGGEMAITDKGAFASNYEVDVDELTYARTFSSTDWQALYVPFSMTYDDWKDYMDVYDIYNVLAYDEDNDGVIERTTVNMIRLKEGAVTEPNYPYVIRAKNEGPVEITLEDATLYPAEENSIDCTSTKQKFTFTGNYKKLTGLYTKGSYALQGGVLKTAINDDVELNPQRWYMDVTNRNGSPAAATRVYLNAFGEESEVEGVKGVAVNIIGEETTYDMGGRTVNTTHLPKGLYVRGGKKIIVR